MEEPTTHGASDPAGDRAELRAANPYLGYDGRTLSRDDVAGMLRHAAAYTGLELTERQAWQLAGLPHAAAKAHGNYRYQRGYAHGRDGFDREGPLPTVGDDPRDEQTEKIAAAIRAVADAVPSGYDDDHTPAAVNRTTDADQPLTSSRLFELATDAISRRLHYWHDNCIAGLVVTDGVARLRVNSGGNCLAVEHALAAERIEHTVEGLTIVVPGVAQ